MCMNNYERKEWIDYLRGIGILLMIIGHASISSKFKVWIYGFHMPLFYVISGYLHNEAKWSEKGFKSFAATRFKNYVVPYFIWCAICFIVNLPLLWLSYPGGSFPKAVLQNIGWIATSVRIDGVFLPQNCTPLWFLTSIFISSVVFYGLLPLDRKKQILVCIGFVLINYCLNILNSPILPWHLDVSLIGAIFMLIGYYFNKCNIISKKTSPVIVLMIFLLASVLIFYNGQEKSVEMYYRRYNNYFLFFLSAGMMSFCLLWVCMNSKIFVLKNLLLKLGTQSIIVLGINYTINLYLKGLHSSISSIVPLFPAKPLWYENIIINIILCLLAFKLYSVYSAKHKKLHILLGK